MFKSLACFAFLIIQLLTVDSFASASDSRGLAAGKEIYGKGIHHQCLPFALGLAQILNSGQLLVASCQCLEAGNPS
jgi:hypothetical protein